MARAKNIIVEVEGYDGDGGRVLVENYRADGSRRMGVFEKIYCIGSIGDDGVVRFNDWGYATVEEAKEALTPRRATPPAP